MYDLSPEALGSFDLVYVGSLLLHLRDPVGALERVRSVCAGELVLADAVDARLERWGRRHPRAVLDGRGRPWWWRPNAAGLARMVEAAGFEVARAPGASGCPSGRAARRSAGASRHAALLGRGCRPRRLRGSARLTAASRVARRVEKSCERATFPWIVRKTSNGLGSPPLDARR